MKPNIENFIGCDASYFDADIVLFGAPFDSTTSFRPGARFGSAAMRHESFGIETWSPYQHKDLTDCAVFDSGDLELCFGSAELALADIEDRAREILEAGKLPLLLGDGVGPVVLFGEQFHRVLDSRIELLGDYFRHRCDV